ncbi:ATP-dependent helicase [Shewanella sp. BF02_Schw]|uniref:ATP-dependent helicase n=1 Tax=Shewanella sp. BF02_Schw TaxID=394908 RepID=UPI001781CF45|nr:ATP-dependent helicase [Shewanella sp. BF02_Schw]MBO1897570.1 ATP-dependent helicase [Shewanella sp. BF02_Schw]
MIDKVLARLNKQQYEVATTLNGIIRTLAGPGTGKTGTQTAHIANLINIGVNPESILAITFTNKAASETRHRIVKNTEDLGSVGWQVAASTYHSFCRKHILKPFQSHEMFINMGYENGFIILDDSDSESVMKEVYSNSVGGFNLVLDALGITEKQMLRNISDHRSKGIDFDIFSRQIKHDPIKLNAAKELKVIIDSYPISLKGVSKENKALMSKEIGSRLQQINGDFNDAVVAIAWKQYAKDCAAADGLDFDDQLLFAMKLLQHDKTVASRLAKRFEYIFLDEFQDSNMCQWQLMKSIINAQKSPNLFIVGDDYQSIYRFRNANVEIMKNLDKELPTCITNSLINNYRSTAAIINLSNALTAQMPNQIGDGQLIAASGITGEKPTLEIYNNAKEEADGVVATITSLIQRGERPSDIAVLYRNRTVNKELIEALNLSRMDYDIIGDVGFYQTAEIKSAVAILRILTRNTDVFAYAKVLDYATVGISAVRLKSTTHENGSSPLEAIDFIMNKDKRAKSKAESFVSDIKSLIHTSKQLATHERFLELLLNTEELKNLYKTNPSIKAKADGQYRDITKRTVGTLATKFKAFWETHLLPSFVKDSHKVAIKKSANMDGSTDEIANELVEKRKNNFNIILERVLNDMNKPGAILSELVDDLVQRIDQEGNDDLESIQLLTNHASKGLEFPHVFLIGTEEESYNSLDSDLDDIEEEGRNFFVASTRAKASLHISASVTRVVNGNFMNRSLLKLLYPLLDKLDLSERTQKVLNGTDNRFEDEFQLDSAPIPNGLAAEMQRIGDKYKVRHEEKSVVQDTEESFNPAPGFF